MLDVPGPVPDGVPAPCVHPRPADGLVDAVISRLPPWFDVGERLDRFRAWMGHEHRNDELIDVWSGVHLVTGIAFGWLMDPFIGLLLLVLWEPLEILVLSPLAKRYLRIEFGFETLRNSMSDIFFDALGVAVGYWGLRVLVGPPFCLWC